MTPIATTLRHDRGDRDDEPEPAPADDVDPLPARDLARRRAHEAGVANQRKPASRPSIARVAATAVTSEMTVPISSISAKPLTSEVATPKRTSAVIAVTTFASTIVRKPLA